MAYHAMGLDHVLYDSMHLRCEASQRFQTARTYHGMCGILGGERIEFSVSDCMFARTGWPHARPESCFKGPVLLLLIQNAHCRTKTGPIAEKNSYGVRNIVMT